MDQSEVIQTGPCSLRLGWGFFKFLNLDNTRTSLKRFRLQFAAKAYPNLKMIFAMFLKVSVLYFLLWKVYKSMETDGCSPHILYLLVVINIRRELCLLWKRLSRREEVQKI